jgi:hypothetical protein
VSGVQQLLNEISVDEAGRAGNENFHDRSFMFLVSECRRLKPAQIKTWRFPGLTPRAKPIPPLRG